ncbi:MAG: ABC transporter substrate-binding protein [Cyanobacteriota bacterium]
MRMHQTPVERPSTQTKVKSFLLPALLLGLSLLGEVQPAASQEVTELTFYYPVLVPGPITELFDQLVSDFTAKNPDIQITPVYSGSYDETTNRIQTQLRAGGELPDLAIIGNQHTVMYVDLDAIVPLDERIQAEGSDFEADLVPAFMLNTRFRGQTWSIPFQRSTPVMYYNKDMFRAAGLDPESPPTNWAEVIEYAQKLTQRDSSGNVTTWGIQIPSDIDAWVIQAMAVGNGQPWVNETDANRVFFDHPATIGVLQHLRALAEDYQVMPGGLIPWAQIPAEFTSGKAAMVYHTIGSQTSILKQTEGKFEVGVAFIPGGQKYGVITGGGNLAIFKQSSPEEQNASWRFIRFLLEPEQMATWSAGTGYLPVTRSAYEHPIFQEYLQRAPGAAVAFEQLNVAAKQMAVHELLRVTDVVKAGIQASITGESTPEQAMQRAQAEADAILSRYRD